MGKINTWLEKKKKQLQDTKSQLEIDKARRQKKKINKVANMKPGARKAISEGLIGNKKPLQVMKEEYQRRKDERERRYRS